MSGRAHHRAYRRLGALAPILAGIALAAWATPAAALTTCTASATPLAFGSVAGTAPVDANGTVSITCSTTAVSLLSVIRLRMCLNIGPGVSGGGQYVPRRMLNSSNDALQFQIFRDPARTLVWGNTAAAAAPTPLETTFEYTVLVIGGGNTLNIPMYGRVPAQAGLAAGNYSNAFTGTNTRLDYRYNEPVVGAPPFPASCTTGGTGGGSITFPFTATAPVPNRCTIASATPMAFGTVPGRVSSNVDRTSTLTFTCTGRTPWTVGLNNGNNPVGTTRRMRQGTSSNYVTYELYSDANRTQRWGATAATGAVTGTGTGASQSLTVHGRVPASQVTPAGNYTDTVLVTITY